MLTCQRYIELNPVRAAMVDDPAHYRWTSYRANGLGQPSAVLTPHPLYLALGEDDKTRQSAYRALFRAQLDKAAVDDIRLARVTRRSAEALGLEPGSQVFAQIKAVALIA